PCREVHRGTGGSPSGFSAAREHDPGRLSAVPIPARQERIGCLVAEKEDYQLARWLLARPMLRLLGGCLAEPAERVRDRLRVWALSDFTVALLKRKEKSSERAIRGWLAELHDAGVVEVVEEQRGRHPATWKLVNPPPDEATQAGLPETAKVFG